jgi:hypothetical protein
MLGIPSGEVRAATTITFTGAELLGRPTDSSITIKIVPNSTIEYYYEYGTTSGSYTNETTPANATGGQPHSTIINGLNANTRYYYRMRYHAPGDGPDDWVNRTEHSFWTQRASGSSFTFTLTSDSHVNIMLGNAATWTQTMNNAAGDVPDFHIDTGDTFAMDSVTTQSAADSSYLTQRQYFDLVGDSASIFLAAGNHEEQEGWHLDDTGNPATSQPVMGTNAQKKYYLNPVPDAFYTGNSDPYSYLDGDHLREDYYAWEWGDALFVIIDPYWYTMTKPFTGNLGGGETSDTGTSNRWLWTLGQGQFNWLKQTLEGSDAAYKFIFAHHMVGGSQDYVRGGAVPAHMFEWGGYNLDGTTWGFETNRPGWGTTTVHQMMIDYGVSAFFHGHDHEYAYEVRDGIVYQSLPAASFTGSFGIYRESDPYTERVISGSGYLRVEVEPSETTVEFVSSASNKNVLHTYTIEPNTPVTRFDLTISADPAAGGTTNPAVGTHDYNQGTLVTVTATPATGYAFDYWSGACTDSGTCSVEMTEDKSVTAHFVKVCYPLILSHVGSGSDPSATPTNSPGCSAGNYHSGESITLSGAVPAAEWKINGWTGTINNSSTANTNTVSMPAAAHAASVIYGEISPTCYSLSLSHSGNGGDPTASPTSSDGCSAGQYIASQSITLTAHPDSGYQVASWTGTTNNSSTAITNTVIMPASSHPASVTYIQTPPPCYTLTLTHTGQGSNPAASPPNSTGCTAGNYHAGENISLSGAVPASGWQISSWTGTTSNSSTANTNAVSMPSSNHTASVVYTQIPPTCYALTLSHTGQGSNPTASPANSTGCSTGQYTAGQVIGLSGAIPASGWQISGWTGTSNNGSTASTNSITMPAMAHSASVIYTEAPPACYALTLNHTGNGTNPTASPTNSTGCTAGNYHAGESISLSGAVPDEGYEIGSWSGTNNNSSTAATNTLTMPAGPRTVSVNYIKTCYALTLTHTGSGADPVASPANSTGCTTGKYTVGQSINLSGAIPASGWWIQSWEGTANDGLTSSTNYLTMPAEDHTVSVNYATEPPPTCYALTLGHEGQGSDPLASPANSTGCSAGTYTSGQSISLSGAVPISGWQISGWLGTSNNSSTANTNSLTMPASNHTASVVYTQIPPTCYALTLSHEGQGSDPLASPTSSAGCAAGTYTSGQSISLSGAIPASGWQISGWSGTANDSSTATTNSLFMPASARTAAVIYIKTQFYYLPLIIN